MKKIFLIKTIILLLTVQGFSQNHASTVINSELNAPVSDVKMRTEYGSSNPELMSILRFENIGLSKMIFSGKDLVGKDFLISIKEFSDGKLVKDELFFDSRETDYFKIKNEEFSFRILTKITAQNTAKFDFQFNGFSKAAEYKIRENLTGFAQKDFLGNQKQVSIPLNTNTYILTYMMPYERNDGSKQYCEVAQSGINPEEFGKKYAIPTYFLISIKFQ